MIFAPLSPNNFHKCKKIRSGAKKTQIRTKNVRLAVYNAKNAKNAISLPTTTLNPCFPLRFRCLKYPVLSAFCVNRVNRVKNTTKKIIISHLKMILLEGGVSKKTPLWRDFFRNPPFAPRKTVSVWALQNSAIPQTPPVPNHATSPLQQSQHQARSPPCNRQQPIALPSLTTSADRSDISTSSKDYLRRR